MYAVCIHNNLTYIEVQNFKTTIVGMLLIYSALFSVFCTILFKTFCLLLGFDSQILKVVLNFGLHFRKSFVASLLSIFWRSKVLR